MTYFSVAPIFCDHEYEDRLVLKTGSSAAIEIPFAGHPEPEAKWQYKGGRLPDARRFHVDTIKGMSSLTMAKTQKTDAGSYTLTLKNSHGKATFSIEVVFLGMYCPFE